MDNLGYLSPGPGRLSLIGAGVLVQRKYSELAERLKRLERREPGAPGVPGVSPAVLQALRRQTGQLAESLRVLHSQVGQSLKALQRQNDQHATRLRWLQDKLIELRQQLQLAPITAPPELPKLVLPDLTPIPSIVQLVPEEALERLKEILQRAPWLLLAAVGVLVLLMRKK